MRGSPSQKRQSSVPSRLPVGNSESEKERGCDVTKVLYYTLIFILFTFALKKAFEIRLHAIQEYGMVIHEFDPWFNFRAAEYLLNNGWDRFFHWFDYQSWYPLGRPVGSTTYPGLPLTAVAIYKALGFLGPSFTLTLKEVCCYIPAWFGCLSTLFLGWLTQECSGSPLAGAIGALVMAMIPAHIVRSIGGWFDNEAIAISAMCATFYFWVRSLRPRSGKESKASCWFYPLAAGVSYGYMVATWGGYVFVTNMIALHATLLCITDWLQGVYRDQLYRSYTVFYIIGTALAIFVPPVGYSPFRSLEQVSGLLVFVFFQLLHLSERHRRRARVASLWSLRGMRIRLGYVFVFLILLLAAVVVLYPAGYFAPLTARVRSLFVQHTKTGNPLVDSVAEHQPATVDAFWLYLHYGYYVAPWGLMALAFHNFHQSSFIALTAVVVYFFALKMSRLIVLMCVPCSALCGIAIGYVLDWFMAQITSSFDSQLRRPGRHRFTDTSFFRVFRMLALGTLLAMAFPKAREFVDHCEKVAVAHSEPQIVFKGRVADAYGRETETILRDYLASYEWLRDNTPEDARILAWWDYGYQITGISNRTTLADGNTWNHEHIALLGYCLTSPENSLIRHLADYVLVWAGGGADDAAKAPWMARIGTSVYQDLCPKDPFCSNFRLMSDGRPTASMRKSLLYQLYSAGDNGAGPDPRFFQHVHTSRHGLVRIYQVMNVSQTSKMWVADSRNRICDKDTPWHCRGQYPPAEEIQRLLHTRRDFGERNVFETS